MANEEREDNYADRASLRGQSLGELPETLFRERGGFPKTRGDAAPTGSGGVPADMLFQSGVASDDPNLPLGSPVQNAKVQTVFDARPINARDFIFGETQLGVGPGGP